MNWKRWKLGLVVACLTGVASGLAALAIGVTWGQFFILVAMNVGKDALLFLKDHPVENIQDSGFMTKADVAKTANQPTETKP